MKLKVLFLVVLLSLLSCSDDFQTWTYSSSYLNDLKRSGSKYFRGDKDGKDILVLACYDKETGAAYACNAICPNTGDTLIYNGSTSVFCKNKLCEAEFDLISGNCINNSSIRKITIYDIKLSPHSITIIVPGL